MKIAAEEIIERLRLVPHPREGGYFRETYRSRLTLPATALPAAYSGDRSASTAIYYLLTPETFSEIHRLPTDEVFHFYLGDGVEMLQLFPDRRGQVLRIGCNLADGESPQVFAPGGVWQGSRLAPGGEFALLGTTVAPGFDFADYTRGDREQLIAEFPEHAQLITALTHVP